MTLNHPILKLRLPIPNGAEVNGAHAQPFYK